MSLPPKRFAVMTMILFRYRCEYLHVPTSSRILFTTGIPCEVTGPPPYDRFYLSLGTAGDAMAKRAAAKWIEATGLAAECVLLSVVPVTDKMSVWVPEPTPRWHHPRCAGPHAGPYCLNAKGHVIVRET